jgi:hypothetical protein
MADHPEAMAALRRLLTNREPAYALAHATIDTSAITADEALDRLESAVRSCAADAA